MKRLRQLGLRDLVPGLALAAAAALLSALLPLGTASAPVTAGAAAGVGDSTGDALDAFDPASPDAAGGGGGPTVTSLDLPGASGAGAASGAVAGAAKADAAKGATYQGVTATTVKWGFSSQDGACGGFSQEDVAGSFGINANNKLDYELAKEYWNKFPLVDYPLPPEIRANVNPQKGYWGRKITSVFRDSGGIQCQDVGRANAVTMAESDKVFGLIMPPTDGPEVPMSLVMAQHKLIHIGRWMTGPSFWKARSPYFYDGRWGDSVTQNIALGSWVCRDWINKRASDTGDPRVSGMPRKFAVLYPEEQDMIDGADVLVREVARCGLKPQRYTIPFELTTLEANAQTVTSRMIRDGITTILSVNDFLTRFLVSKSATGQAWHPEWVNSGFGIGSFPIAYATFMAPDQAVNAWAAADEASIAHPPYHQSEPYLAFKRIRPDEEPDDNWANFYYQFKLLALGLAGAGPNLTPITFGEGLGRLCNPCARPNNKLPLKRVFPGHWTNNEGFVLVKWNPNKPNTYDTPDSNGNPKRGYFDFIEGGKRYGLRITDPDSG